MDGDGRLSLVEMVQGIWTTEGGRFGEVFVDATVGLPIMCAALFERLGKGYKKPPHKMK